jgi:hypothetical protein
LVMMDLERVWTPPPQSWEQVEKAVQPERTQSMGQACVLQVLEAEGVGQVTPPLAAEVTTERVLVWEPVPQDLVHAPYLDQPETLQSMGQAYVLQVVVELKPGQPTPPRVAAVRSERVLVLEPVPQDLVQAL